MEYILSINWMRNIIDMHVNEFRIELFKQELLREYSSINPSGSSYLQYVHFGQLILSGGYIYLH